MNEEFTNLLDKHHLKKTSPRISVLSILKSRNVATSQPELEQIIGKEIDRVTLYRTLTTFEEKGIIHKVLDLNGTSNYALSSSSKSNNQLHDEHVHFNCTVCLNVYCLDQLHVPKLSMPQGFSSQNVNVIVYGICYSCNKKAEEFIKNKDNA